MKLSKNGKPVPDTGHAHRCLHVLTADVQLLCRLISSVRDLQIDRNIRFKHCQIAHMLADKRQCVFGVILHAPKPNAIAHIPSLARPYAHYRQEPPRLRASRLLYHGVQSARHSQWYGPHHLLTARITHLQSKETYHGNCTNWFGLGEECF